MGNELCSLIIMNTLSNKTEVWKTELNIRNHALYREQARKSASVELSFQYAVMVITVQYNTSIMK